MVRLRPLLAAALIGATLLAAVGCGGGGETESQTTVGEITSATGVLSDTTAAVTTAATTAEATVTTAATTAEITTATDVTTTAEVITTTTTTTAATTTASTAPATTTATTVTPPEAPTYRLLYSPATSSANYNAMRALRAAIGEEHIRYNGDIPIYIGDNAAYAEVKALSATLDYLDYVIRADDTAVFILGGSPLSTSRALDRAVILCELGQLVPGFCEQYDFSSVRADSLLYHLDEFTPVWANRLTVPAWLHDFEEKSYAITAGEGRFLSDAHRGDSVNYPENSLEGIYSAILLGADVIEIDVRLTADHVPVLMHDETLTRTTDVAFKRGQNGFPASAKVEDWTYEQLMQLRLKLNGRTTDCKIPTAYEAVALCAGRCFINWDAKVTLNINTDVYLLAEELGAKESFLYYFGVSRMEQWLALDPSDTEFSAYIAAMKRYLALPGHKLASRNYNHLAKYGDHVNGWESVVENTAEHCLFTDRIEAMMTYIAQSKSPVRVPNP